MTRSSEEMKCLSEISFTLPYYLVFLASKLDTQERILIHMPLKGVFQ